MDRIRAYDIDGNLIRDRLGRECYTWDYFAPNSRPYWKRILHWISQGVNVFSGGHEDLTFSQRVGGWVYYGEPLGDTFAPLINAIFRDDEHCRNAWLDKV